MKKVSSYVINFEELKSKDVELVGGKNSSLGEMTTSLKEKGIKVPDGFATTSEAYWLFIESNNLKEAIQEELDSISKSKKSLAEAGKNIRRMIKKASFPENIEKEIRQSYQELCKKYNRKNVDVAVRSSATAEDLPQASFAGQQDSYLNISGEDDLIEACINCYASLFNNRAISYREEKGFEHMKVALSVGVQKMIRSDKSGAGVMFSIDTESGFPDVAVITAAWGLGENVVQGTVNPDEYQVFKPLLDNKKLKPIVEKNLGEKETKIVYSTRDENKTKTIPTTKKEQNSFVLTDDEIIMLAKWATLIEKHYKKPMDIEWAKDGETNEIYIVQARPETVQSQIQSGTLKTYSLDKKGKEIISGISIGSSIAAAEVCMIKSAADIADFKEGSILVTEMTDPDWVPILKKAKGVITDYGGRTCHAAIVSRELGIPAIVGTGEATSTLKDGQEITLSCAEGEKGIVYQGILDFSVKDINLENIPDVKTRIMINVASPSSAYTSWNLPVKGIGLARMEFIINNIIKIHPMALINYDQLKDEKAKKQIKELTNSYDDKKEYFVDNLAFGIAKIASSQYPEPVIVRMSDFKTNEYASLIGGSEFEPDEENPMLGFRGASRYYSEQYKEGFKLECQAIKKVRNEIGLDNVIIMIPFCRTLDEADKVLKTLKNYGLESGKANLQVYVMCEIPANVILAEEFCKRFDGFSIGSNDLTQLVLGIDRDSTNLSELFDERNDAVKIMIKQLITTAHKNKKKVGICGQAPSDYPEFSQFLVEVGIDSISVNPDSVLNVIEAVAKTEKRNNLSIKNKF